MILMKKILIISPSKLLYIITTASNEGKVVELNLFYLRSNSPLVCLHKMKQLFFL